MLKTAYNYLGVFPILARIYLNLNIPPIRKKVQVNFGIEMILVTKI